MELAQAFVGVAPSTRLRLRHEVLSGTLESLTAGHADLALGVALEQGNTPGIQTAALGDLLFVYVVAPHHPLAAAPEPLSDEVLQKHRAIAVADSVQRGLGITSGLLAGQDVLTVPSMRTKLDAQLRGLGGGFIPEPMARPYIETGRLVLKSVERSDRVIRPSYAWRSAPAPGRALQWWLQQLKSPATRRALLEQQRMPQ